MSNFLDNLNPAQQKAVQIKDGPILILAGAGSGKTRSLTYRIAYLINHHHISPSKILAVTFTNKAADEMKKRINQLLGGNNFLPWMGTFHSICVKILRQQLNHTTLPYSGGFTILDESDSISIIKKIIKRLQLDPRRINPRSVKAFISGAKNELMTPAKMTPYAQGPFQEKALQIYQAYQTRLKELNGLDFDDLLMLTVRLLKKYPHIKKYYQSFFQYILIDEYQDTNTAQYQLVRLLSDKHHNLCVVGDDFQSIYGFRNADFRNILNFKQDYPQAQVIKLEQNYRSTKNILSAAQKIIEKNTQRTDKRLWTANSAGPPVTLAELENEREEALFVINEIKDLAPLGIRPADCVILYRTHAQSRAIEEELMKAKVKYKIIGGVSFYERKEIKDILAYLKLLINPRDDLSLERAVKNPPRGIGPKTLAHGGAKLDDFMKLLKKLRQQAKGATGKWRPPAEIIDLTARASGYKDWILDGTPEGEGRWENIKELKSVASDCESLEEFLEKSALFQAADEIDDQMDQVHLMTLHNAKGIEYPLVFMVGMEEGLFPHSRSLLDPMEIEEERRLCYVGATRAMRRLYFTYTQLRKIYGSLQSNLPSRFLNDIPEEVVERI